MEIKIEKVRKTIERIDEQKRIETLPVIEPKWSLTDYKTSDFPDGNTQWMPLEEKPSIEGECHIWISAELDIPDAWQGGSVFLFDDCMSYGAENTLPQTIVYIDGKMTAAFDNNHKYFFLGDISFGRHELLMYVYIPKDRHLYRASYNISLMDEELIDLYYDIAVPYYILDYTKNDSREYGVIREALSVGCHKLDLLNRETVKNTAWETKEYLRENLYDKICGREGLFCSCIGHTHIDIAWLWTLAQTREKVQRSFINVLNMMERYPEYKFMSSQPQLYKYLKEEAPDIYEKVKEKVKSGRWEVEGGMWLEADCNITGGESLIRQIMYGKKFIKEEFGRDSVVLWLPDTFGFTASLPQIMEKTGLKYFVSSKISCNDTDRFPYDIFKWKGIDGTETRAYFLTGQNYIKNQSEPSVYTTYATTSHPAEVRGTWERFQQKDLTNKVLLPFGYGDGGGGPTYEMLEYLRRESYGIPGCPQTEIQFVADYLKRVFEEVEKSVDMPRWVGELYLEFHRGTYTSQGQNKRYNRKSEYLLQRAESAALAEKLLIGADYPRETFERLWETVLLNQFHDILPGSAVKEVYEESEKQYEELISKGEKIREGALSDIADNIKSDGGLLVFNPNSFNATGAVKYGGEYVLAKDIPARGWKVITPEKSCCVKIADDCSLAENEFYSIFFDENMNITKLYDKRFERDVLKAGFVGNEIQAFEDYPRGFDAWEITNYYKYKMTPVNEVLNKEIVDEGERRGIRYIKKFDLSTITQTVYLYSHSARIDFETEIDWKNENILLKAAFPVDVNSDVAAYDIQFGNISRSNHKNTSWDDAKYEVCAHKFSDVSEYGYGVSLLSDSKYGFDTENSVMRITLLKSAIYPDPTADKRKHFFTYSLYPHTGDFRAGETYKEAYLLNQPLCAYPVKPGDGKLPSEYSLVSVEADNVFFETVKLSEDGRGVVLRAYDAYNKKARVKIKTGFDFKNAYICDMLENKEKELTCGDREVTVEIKPFEIVTVFFEI